MARLRTLSIGLLIAFSLVSCHWIRHATQDALRSDLKSAYLLVHGPGQAEQVQQAVRNCDCFQRPDEFIDWIEGQSGFRPGRYRIEAGMTPLEVVLLLRSGKQEPVMLRFQRQGNLEELAGLLGRKFEADSTEFLKAMTDTLALHALGVNMRQEQLPALFIPNSYELYWTAKPASFVERMVKEYRKFWNPDRTLQAQKLGLTEVQVVTLASIVQAEQARLSDEWGSIARLYLNRLNSGMLLQADPTVKFALGDRSLRRIRFQHLKIDHPYNTYIYKGLPPGPISLVESAVIDSVLQSKNHSYIYMCAKADFSGRHAFSSTFQEHKRNAEAFRRELDRRQIQN